MAVHLLMPTSSACVTSSEKLSCMAAVGSTMLMQDRNSSELVAWFATALKFWTLKRAPPNRKQQPAGNNHRHNMCPIKNI